MTFHDILPKLDVPWPLCASCIIEMIIWMDKLFEDNTFKSRLHSLLHEKRSCLYLIIALYFIVYIVFLKLVWASISSFKSRNILHCTCPANYTPKRKQDIVKAMNLQSLIFRHCFFSFKVVQEVCNIHLNMYSRLHFLTTCAGKCNVKYMTMLWEEVVVYFVLFIEK